MLFIFYIAWQLLGIFNYILDFLRTVTSNKPIIPATNITELVVECVHNDYVTKPSALKVFIDGLAEFVVDKGLINNKDSI